MPEGDPPETRTVATPDARTLAYVEVGDPTGALVIHNHGGPGSRYEVALFASCAAENGLRLVGVDRPGIGRSDPQRNRSFAGWAADLVTLADALGHNTFGVIGWSEGGPWALAAAAYVDDTRLRHVSSVGGGSYGAFGDNWAAEYLSRADALGGRLALQFRLGFRLMYSALGFTVRHFPATFAKQLRAAVNDYDRDILSRTGFEATFYQSCVECFAQGSSGLVDDATLLYRKWAFDVAAIERPVHVWQGLDDRLVASPINKTVAGRMPGAIWHPIVDGGHFIAIGAARQILAIAAAELGR